jgi:hypothetical protein
MAQVALMVMGLIVWGYGSRTNDSRLTFIGMLFFAAAVALRVFKRRQDPPEAP